MASRTRARQPRRESPPPAPPPVDPLLQAADRAAVTGEAGLPIADRQAELLAIRRAFQHYTDGADDAARDQLATIGLGSPFLEWKLLLRGLIAYANRDDDRALDNWRRLDARRAPARLAAPLRATIDRGWLASLPAQEQAALRSAADLLLGEPFSTLRQVQSAISRAENLADAMKTVGGLLPRLRKSHPDAVPVVARACYALASLGDPRGAERLKPYFEPPPDDPTWSRLEAIAAERRGEFLTANRHWEQYQQVVAGLAPFRNRSRARALIWLRCAENAEQLPPLLAMRSRQSAEQFYRRALAQDSTLTAAQRGLFDWYRSRHKVAEALTAGRRLLELDPSDGDAAGALGALSRESGDVESAVDFFERASAAAPLEASWRQQLSAALTDRARLRAIHGEEAAAVADLDRAEQVGPGQPAITRLALRSAIAYCFGDLVRGHELAERARAIDALAAACALVGEAARFKLPKPIRKPLDDDLSSQWRRLPKPESALALAGVLLDCKSAPEYRGFKSHLSKARSAIESVSWQIEDPALGERLCELLDGLGWAKPLVRLARFLGDRFPREPAFPYYWACSFAEADTPRGIARALQGLRWAMRLAEELPSADPRRRLWIERVKTETESLARLGMPTPHALLELAEDLS